MTTFTPLAPAPSAPPEPFTDRLRLAVAASLARFTGSSREHTESALRCYLTWCTERSLDPLAAGRPHLELYIRSMQEIRRFKPSTVSRRFSVTAGFYRTCVIDEIMEHSPAEHVRRPAVPAESPTLGFTHAFAVNGGRLTQLRTSPFPLPVGAAPAGIVISQLSRQTRPEPQDPRGSGLTACYVEMRRRPQARSTRRLAELAPIPQRSGSSPTTETRVKPGTGTRQPPATPERQWLGLLPRPAPGYQGLHAFTFSSGWGKASAATGANHM